MNFDLDFYKGKKVFVTGHTGFKGSWLCKMLVNAGAIVTGYSLNPPTSPSLYEIAGIEQDVHSVIGDIRDFKTLKAAFDEAQPEIVLHLAAQPIVRDSYKNPAYTYETNVMGLSLIHIFPGSGRPCEAMGNRTCGIKLCRRDRWTVCGDQCR